VPDGVSAASKPSAPFATMPLKRVACAFMGEVPDSASARSSTPAPHAKTDGSIAPALGEQVVPPGTRASDPGAHARPTTSVEPPALRAASSHAVCVLPVASRKYVLEAGLMDVDRGKRTGSKSASWVADSRIHTAPPPPTSALARASA